jgi:hypothetical protein
VDFHARMKISAARARLQNAEGAKDSLQAIREIIAGLIGSQEMAIFTVDKQKAVLWHHWSHGIEAYRYPYVDLLCEPLLLQVLEGKSLFRSCTEYQLTALHDPVSALIPISLEGVIVAILVIFRLPSHKSELGELDRLLCQLIGDYGGRALLPDRPL